MNNNWKEGRKILLGVTGGIAAYKIPALVRLIKKAGCEVEIILTKSAENFVAPMTLETLSGKKIWNDKNFDSTIPHVKLAEWADVFLIAPCTANTIAKIAHGISDNLLTSAAVACDSEIMIFPAMNEKMFNAPVTQENLKILAGRNFKIISPAEGPLACGVNGKGRMPEPENILLEIFRSLCPVKDLAGKNVLVTAGPTHEYLDPVRFISNPSSGKMGAAMARAAWYRGADVKIISGPVEIESYGFEVIKIKSALEMLEAVKNNLEWADYIVKAAAVGDYRAKNFSAHKIKREGRENFSVELESNPDIAHEIGKIKGDKKILIGFAAETDNLSSNARGKLERKNLDYILANEISSSNAGFASDYNKLHLISREQNQSEKIFSGLKEDIAFDVWDFIK
ncbi:MAG: bifunctional phosphopantothenoylcysteine decarboxylase/phosphopantothenate--cysteine ligase CoaBC [Synergistaceae bacterium]|nr:bifunctional phosphopantothenoylcysteine decarboxylase/phosphopantothenate--cysteine ligase CoaBC [Synergistaceae bacterium]